MIHYNDKAVVEKEGVNFFQKGLSTIQTLLVFL